MSKIVDKFPPKMKDLMMWKKPVESGVVLGACLLGYFLLEKSTFTLITLVADTLLILLIAYNAWKAAHHFNKSVPKPFSMEWEMSDAQARKVADRAVLECNRFSAWVYNFVTVKDVKTTIGFAVALYIVQRVGSWFNLLTIMMFAVVAFFTIPIFYKNYGSEVDTVLNFFKEKLKVVTQTVSEKVEIVGSKIPKAKSTANGSSETPVPVSRPAGDDNSDSKKDD